MGEWKVRFAPQNGFPYVENSYFAASAASPDPVDQIRYMAELGFAGMAEHRLWQRPVVEQERIGRELAVHGMALGAVGFSGTPKLLSLEPSEVNARLVAAVENALAVVQRGGGRTMTVLAMADATLPRSQQMQNMSENLKRVAPLAERAGVTLCIEAVSPQRLAGVLIERTAEAEAIRREVDSPAVRLMFDVAHVALEGDDVIDTLRQVAPQVAAIQLSDLPGRLELGSGTLDFPAIIRAAIATGFEGLYELEHSLSEPGEVAEARMVSMLREINAAI